MQLPCRGGGGPLHLLVDNEPSSAIGPRTMAGGIEVRGEGGWRAREHGGTRRLVRRKVHIAVGAAADKVRAVEFVGVGDAPTRPGLPSQIPRSEPIASVTADGAHDGRGWHGAIARRGADAVIRPRRNAKPWVRDGPGAAGRNDALRAAIERLGRAIGRRWSGHRRRSRAETKTTCTKPLGQTLAARDLGRRTAELRIRIASLDRFTALGLPVTQPVGRPRTGKTSAVSQTAQMSRYAASSAVQLPSPLRSR